MLGISDYTYQDIEKHDFALKNKLLRRQGLPNMLLVS